MALDGHEGDLGALQVEAAGLLRAGVDGHAALVQGVAVGLDDALPPRDVVGVLARGAGAVFRARVRQVPRRATDPLGERRRQVRVPFDLVAEDVDEPVRRHARVDIHPVRVQLLMVRPCAD